MLPKRGADRIGLDTAVLGCTTPAQIQIPTCVICALIASVHCEKLPPEQEGNDSSQGTAGETGRSAKVISLPACRTHMRTHTHTPPFRLPENIDVWKC